MSARTGVTIREAESTTRLRIRSPAATGLATRNATAATMTMTKPRTSKKIANRRPATASTCLPIREGTPLLRVRVSFAPCFSALPNETPAALVAPARFGFVEPASSA